MKKVIGMLLLWVAGLTVGCQDGGKFSGSSKKGSESPVKPNGPASSQNGEKDTNSDTNIPGNIIGENSPNTDPKDPAVNAALHCGSILRILKSSDSVALLWKSTGEIKETKAELSSAIISDKSKLGTVVSKDPLNYTYTAPKSIVHSGFVNIDLSSEVNGKIVTGRCAVMLMADTELGVPTDNNIDAPIGNVYRLLPNTSALPDFDKMVPVAEMMLPNFDVPKRSFTQGFPGVRSLFEWFGVKFEGKIKIPTAGEYEFKLSSDDGSILYIDGNKFIDNDGLHPVEEKVKSIRLSEGLHTFRLDYYQGPRTEIALQLFWRTDSSKAFEIIPAKYFFKP